MVKVERENYSSQQNVAWPGLMRRGVDYSRVLVLGVKVVIVPGGTAFVFEAENTCELFGP